MVYWIADNVLSPIGATTAENMEALKAGHSALSHHASYSGRKEDDYVASRFTDEQQKQLMVSGLTWFESLVFHSVCEAMSHCAINLYSPRTLFVLSTTKANVEHLTSADYDNLQPAESAKRIVEHLRSSGEVGEKEVLPAGVPKTLVVCNACISGVAALVTAQRLLSSGCYDTAIVVGCDVVSHFVVSGFQSLKAMSPEPCRPFDIERMGLNLGEAAATLILSTQKPQGDCWQITEGAIRNDAYHISSPSPKGEGCASAIGYVTRHVDLNTLSAVNVHGTATMYNDQMESKAIERAGLSEVPLNTLKGYYGHTLGASGVLETIITKHSVQQGELLPTRGFTEIGVSGRVTISSETLHVSQPSFVKIISGFGGCNAALLVNEESFSRMGDNGQGRKGAKVLADASDQGRAQGVQDVQGSMVNGQRSMVITPHSVTIDGNPIEVEAEGSKLLTELYKRFIGSYPRFYKMDRLSQLGFVASELLLKGSIPSDAPAHNISAEDSSPLTPKDSSLFTLHSSLSKDSSLFTLDLRSSLLTLGKAGASSALLSLNRSLHSSLSNTAVVLFNHSSSLWADREYQRTIIPGEDYFPSPSLFVYTLPNMVCGEIAIRNGFHAETSFYILDSKDEALMNNVLLSTFRDHTIDSILTGWLDYQDDNNFEAEFRQVVPDVIAQP